MPTPFETKVLEDYAIALATADVVNSELQTALLAAISGESNDQNLWMVFGGVTCVGAPSRG